MQAYQEEFIHFALSAQILQFGEFKLKSGRSSPYFFHIAQLFSGENLLKLSRFYAQALTDGQLEPDGLFGPAYKGIPLVTSLAQTLALEYQQNLPCLFNRKETKDHGENGRLIGPEPKQGERYLIVDDVLTSGKAVAESLPVLGLTGTKALGLLIALDRQERAHLDHPESARKVLENQGLKVVSIISLASLIEYLKDQSKYSEQLDSVNTYREKYAAIDRHN